MADFRLTSRVQARGADGVLRDSGTGPAIPRCLERSVRQHMRFFGELLLNALGLPVFRVGVPHPLACKCSFDGIAADLALVAIGGVWPFPECGRMGEIERDIVSLEFRFGDWQFGDLRLAVDNGAAAVAERASQRVAAELEFQGGHGGECLGLGAGYSNFPSAGGIDVWLPGAEG